MVVAAQPLPARMLNEWVYCPRLAFLEHVHGEWADSAETEDGKRVHRRVDQVAGAWPNPYHLEGAEVARSVWMTAPLEGITAKLDLVEAVAPNYVLDATCASGGVVDAVDCENAAPTVSAKALLVRPVDYKRGQVPDGGPWPPERVQICAQALVLRESGYRCDEGALWFDGSKRRVLVAIDAPLIEQTRKAARELRDAIERDALPAPLQDSPKCTGCSLAGICLPDEVGLLEGRCGDPSAEPEERLERRLIPARDDGTPLHVLTQGARIGVSGGELVVRKGAVELGRASLPMTSRVAIHGRVQISTQALTRLMHGGTPVAFHSMSGWFQGSVAGMPHNNIFVRKAQHAAAIDPSRALTIAKTIVQNKIVNQRTLLRRNRRDGDAAETRRVLVSLKAAHMAAGVATDLGALMGHEGVAARAYFGAFDRMLADTPRTFGFRFITRNRRPATDPINAVLSFAYAMLARECTQVALHVGLEPLLGFLHQPRHGRPALALDLMEPFRPIVADSTVLRALNNGELQPKHFLQRGPACTLTKAGKTKLIAAFERRMDQLVTHPVFGYRVSYRRVIEVQTRLLTRYLLGEIAVWPTFEVR